MSNMPTADFAYLTDLHFSISKSPKWFGGSNYYQDQLIRFKEAIDLAESYGVGNFILGGDLFDHYNDANSKSLDELVEIFNSFSGYWYITIGNHDLLGKSLDGFPKSIIRFFLNSLRNVFSYPYEVVDQDSSYGEYDVFPRDPLKYEIHFGHWGNKFESSVRSTQVVKYPYDPEGFDRVIAVIHSPVGPTLTEYCTSVHDIKVEGFDLVLFGDQHEGWQPILKDNAVIANPGSFSWNSVDDLNRPPRIGFYNLISNSYWEEELRSPELKSFNHIPSKKSIKAIKNFQVAKSFDYTSLVELKGEELKISNETTQWLITEIQKNI